MASSDRRRPDSCSVRSAPTGNATDHKSGADVRNSVHGNRARRQSGRYIVWNELKQRVARWLPLQGHDTRAPDRKIAALRGMTVDPDRATSEAGA